MNRFRVIAAGLCAALAMMSAPTFGQTVMYYDAEADWLTAVTSTGATAQSLPTTPGNVELATQINSPPGTNTELGTTLSFLRGDTGLLVDFWFKAVNIDPGVPGRALVYDDNEQGFPAGQRIISIGDIDGVPGFPASESLYQNDDFRVEFNQNCDVVAFGITLVGNLAAAGEALRVYAAGDVLLATFTSGLPDNNDPNVGFFVGVVSDVPIVRVEWDEADDGDDIGVRDFQFGIEIPALQNTSYFDDDTAWSAAVAATGAIVETLPTTPTNIALADEITAAPGTNAELGTQLTFAATSTGLLSDFSLVAINVDPAVPGRALVYDDDEGGFPLGERVISIGDIDGVPGFPASVDLYQDDDFDITIAAASGDVNAVGFVMYGNYLVPEENFSVYDESGQLIDVITCELPEGESDHIFLGVVSQIPIGRVSFNEGFGDDDIGIRDFYFGVLPGAGDIAGLVTTECPAPGTGLLGVVVDAFELGTGDLVGSDTTDVDGAYEIADIDAGDYTVTVMTPLGYTIASEDIPVTVATGSVATANFLFTCSEIIPNTEGTGFWKHQVGVATGGKGRAYIDAATLCGYLDIIEEHFNSNAVNQVVVYQPPSSGLCDDKLLVAKDLLNLKGNVGMTERAKQHFMALLMNVAAGYISLRGSVSEDGATLSQAITYCDYLLDDNDAANDELAKDISEQVNKGEPVSPGVIPLDTDDIAYSPRRGETVASSRFALESIIPNPFNPQTNITYSAPGGSHVRLEIYDIRGRLVRILVDQSQAAGRYSATWSGSDNRGNKVASGIYFVRLSAGSDIEVRKLVLLK